MDTEFNMRRESFAISEKEKKFMENDEDLSDLDSEEADIYLVNEEEYKLKKMLWEVIFKEWIQEQKDKEKIKKLTTKKRIRKLSKVDSVVANNPLEAIKNSEKFKKNINMGVIENLFSSKTFI